MLELPTRMSRSTTGGRRLSTVLLAGVVLVAALGVGCRREAGPAASGQPSVGAPGSSSQASGPSAAQSVSPGQPEGGQSAEAASSEAVTLKVVDRAEFENLLKSLRGKVVLVDFWATWCVPCVENFPHTVEWYRKYADRGLVCVSVSFDDPDQQGQNERALQFLKHQGATFINLISRYGADAKSFDEFDIGGGGIPHYKLYDRQGNLVGSFGNDDPDHPLDPAEVEQAIVAALQETG